MAYGYSIKKRNSKKAHAKTRQIEPRLVLATLAMAAGIFAAPFGVVEASTITRKEGVTAPAIVQNEDKTVFTIDPEKVNGDFAYNRFSAFSLDAGHIANLNFGSASTLANLVNDKIDINGTVNAIKGSAIGGHLYFLSPDGIAVGATGVINAGQFTGIVPTRTAFDTLYNSANITLDNITGLNSYAIKDKDGKAVGIDVSGQINTHSGVMLGAGIINIQDGAKIQSTKDLNFTSLVNTGSANAGLTNLTASTGSGGDIILTAKQTSDVKDTKTTKDAQGNDKTEANPIRWRDRSTDLSAAVNIGKDATTKGVSITSSDGAVKLTATSATTYEDSTPMTLTNTLKDVILGDDKTLLDGVVNKLAGKEASANKYLFVNYSNKKNKSSVNIGEGSNITGKNIDVSATSTVDIKQSVAVPAQGKDSEGKTVNNDSVMPVAAVAISRVYNNADVVINGNLTASGADAKGNGIVIAANADTKAALSATAAGGEKTSAAVGVAVLSGDTKSKVTVNAPTNATPLSATQGKVSVDATTTSDVGVNVNAVGTKSYVVSNVGVANYDASADVIVNRSVTAGAVDVKAENNITGLKMTVDNTKSGSNTGKETETRDDDTDNADVQKEKNKGDSGKSQDEKNSEKKSVDPTKVVQNASVNTTDTTDAKTQDAAGGDGKGGVKDVVDKVNGTNNGGDNGSKTSAFGLGAAVGVVSNTNNANVTIGKSAEIKATKVSDAVDGSVKVAADTLMTASKDKENNWHLSQFSVKNALANANVEIGAAVLVSNVKNNANILLDTDGTKSAQITGNGAVALNAAAGMGKYQKSETEKETSTLTYTVSAEGTAKDDKPATVVLDGSVGVNTLKNNAVVFLGQQSKVEGTEVKLASDTTANAKGTYGATEENSKVGVGATVGIQNIRNNSLVMAGKGAELKGTGGSGSVSASANNSLDAKNEVKNAGKGESFGVSGMVALSYGDSNSIVSLDDEALINAPSVSVESTNSTKVDNSARSEAAGGPGSKAFGIGVGIVNYDVNSVAMIADNGSGITAPTVQDAKNPTDAEKAAQKIYNDAKLAQSVAGTALAGKLGTKTGTDENGKPIKGVVTTDDLSVSATTTGMLKNDAKAKAVSEEKANDAESGDGDKSEKWTNWSKQGTEGANDAKNKTTALENDTQTSQNESAAPTVGATSQTNNATGAMGEASRAADPDGTNNAADAGAAPAANSPQSAGASIGVEGSVALTFLGGRTDAVLDNVKVQNGDDGVSSVDLSATDFLGSITLGGTNTKNSLASGSATKVGIGGTFAMNKSTRNVDSLLRNSTIQNVSYLANEASKIGIEVAAGMGTSGNSGSGTSVSGSGVVYYNKAVQDVHALMIDNNVTSNSTFTLLSNEATSTDFQIAGGLAYNSASGENTNVGVGGAVAISQLENNLASGLIGGKYNDFTTVRVEAEKGTTQINGALAATKAGGASGYGFEGAFAYGSVKNNVHAYIKDAETQDTLGLGKVSVKAGEVSIDLAAETEAKKQEIANVNKLTDKKKQELQAAKEKEKTEAGKNKTTLEGAGVDPTGKIYLDTSDTKSSLGDIVKDSEGKETDEGKIADEAAGDEKSAKSLLDGNYSRTITAAMAGGWAGKAGVGAGIAYNYVKNDISADITGSTLATYEVTGEAASNSLIVSVGAGAAIGGKAFNGAGSGSWNDLKNDTKVNIEGNTIKGATLLNVVGLDAIAGGKLTAKAENTSSIINIAGEVAGGKGMAMGLSLAYNSLNNTTGSYLTGNTIEMPDIAGTGDSSVKVTTLNKSNALAVAGGVDVSIDQSNVGAVGTVAINRGVNHTESVIDGKTSGENTKLDNLNSLVVAAEDVTKKTTVAGGVSVGGSKVGVGGAVAYTSVGSSNNKERLRAEINNADVTTTKTGVISVSTADSKTTTENNTTTTEKSRITTVGAGIGVGWGKNYFNLQGAAAVSDIYKDSTASLNNTNINATEEDKNNHPTIDVTADTKSKINTVGAVGNISVNGKVTGTAGVAINRINQDTKAEMATKDGKTTTVNAGRTEVRATGDADIHSVGVGGTVSVNEYVAFAGSGSYNYIDNDVNAIIKNQNLTSNNNVGVVAQSDDRLYNFAGAFAIGGNTKAGLGAAVSINKITGSTNALVSGGSVAASDSNQDADVVKITRPNDDNLFTTEKLDLKPDRTKLSENRKEESKSGIVVDSSATHTVISQMSSGGVAASASVGVKLDGTVNINTIEGSTTAKIKDANLNTENNASNINVNAIDYTNLGTFTGTPSVGAAATAGVSVGVSADWETLDRTTTAEISSASGKKDVYAKNLTVDATAKHGSSTLSFAAAAGAAATAGVASGDSIVRHKNTSETTALLKNMDAVFDGAANIRATHLGNSHTQNISASAAGGYAAVAAGAGVSVMDDTSTVKAEVDGSNLKAKSSTDGKNISVLATNENNWKETLVTASLAVGLGAGLAANVGIHNTTGETAALVTNSQLEAHDVTVKATDKLTATNTGGVGAAGVGGVGVSVALNNINSSVSAQVSGGSVTASNDIDVKAEEVRSFDSSVTGVAVGGLGVGVNVAVTSVGKGITQAQLSSASDEKGNSMNVNTTTQNEINLHLNGNGSNYSGVNGAKGALGVSNAKFAGLSSKDSDLSAARNTTVSLNVSKEKTDKQGVHTSVKEAALTADGNVNVKAQEQSDVKEKNVTVTVGGAAVGVTDAIIHKNYDTDVTMTGATVTGRNVTVEALQGQKSNGSEINVTAVSVGAGLGVGVGYAGIVNNGATDVNISGSTIKSTGTGDTDKGVTVNAKDDSKSKTDITNVGVSALNVTTTFASVENNANVGVALGGTNNISANKDVTIDATKANALEAHTSGVGVGGVAVAVNHATIEDKGNATAKITGTDGAFSADNKFHLGATNNTTGKLSAGNVTVSILGVSRMRGKGVMNMGAEVGVAGGSFNAKTAEFASLLGDSKTRTLEGNVKGHNISLAVAVAPDAVVLNTTATGTVDVKNSTFGENTDLILDNESYVDRKAYIYDVTAGAVAVGNSSADVYGKETLTTSLAGKSGVTNKLNSLQVLTYGENTGKAFADAGGGGLGGYIGAHVRNDSINNVTSSLSGTWETAGDVWLVAAQNDEVKLTASEGHGGVIGVGGTSADNYITTTTNANVANGTVINADRVHIGTSNVLTTGAYDDTDNKGNKDVQTYTLKDHFGGAIAGNRLRSFVDLTENGTVSIGANAKITTNGLQEYIAASQNDLTNLVQAKGGAAVGITDALSEFDLDVHNKVNVGSGALLTNEKAASTEDVILAAYDNQTLKSHVDATTGAAAAAIEAKNDIDMNRTSSVNVAGTIESSAKVGLYAGAKKDGALSNLNADLKSGAYNYSAIPVAIPRVKYDITADRGNVDVSGTVRSTGDINVIASGGKEEVVKDESVWNWANGGSSTDKKFLTSDATTAEESLPKKSTVTVTGSLIAGTANPVNLTIDGSVLGEKGITIAPATSKDNNDANRRVIAGVTQGTFDYANTLGARLEELNNLIDAYKESGDASKMAAYITERTRIQGEMERLGLVEKDAEGHVTAYVNSGRSVYYVEIPDISSSGGNINVQANDFVGTGNLRANSAPSVTITNNSDAYLKLNNIIMGEQGGKIVYNKDNIIPPPASEGNTKINSINVSKSGARFREIYGVEDGKAAGLTVENLFSGNKTSTVTLTPAMKNQMKAEVKSDAQMSAAEKEEMLAAIDNQTQLSYTAITDVEVNGKISNFYGDVTIKNTNGDIRISGGTQDRPTGVSGNTVKLMASGTIAQDYKEGIVNINGDPEKYLNTNANELKTRYPVNVTGDGSTNSGNATYTRSDSSTASGYIAGRDVYVSASNINVNGLIQSGYKNYGATITETDLAAAKTRPANRAAVVQNRTMYKVNDGGAKWNDTDKVFDYVAQVYWDPSTDKLVVEDIDTQGGKIYLTGMIASTGQGRILAADGAANITVENQTALDMNVGKVLNNQREGVITIADTANDSWTEYRKGQTRTIQRGYDVSDETKGYAAYLKEHAADGDPYAGATKTNNNLSVGSTLQYDVKDGQVYSWVNGASTETTATYQHYERRGFWGLVQTANESTLQGWSSDSNLLEPAKKKELGLPEGAVIGQNSNAAPNANTLYYNASNKNLSETISGRQHWVRRSGFLGWFKHIYDRWKKGTSSIQLYNYSLNASQPITIGLIGAEVGKIDIKSTKNAGGSINLTGNVANSNNLATLTVNSAAGKITQFDNTTLKSEIVNLTAKDDIKNIHLASVGTATKDANGNVTSVNDNIKLSAISTGAGDIDVTAVGGVLNNQSLQGNVEIVALKSQNGNAAFASNAALGDVTLTANGNITQSVAGVTVEGRGITLSSKNGGIGTNTQAINIAGSDLVYSTDRYGAQVNASAEKSIYLTEAAAGGDMRVGKIESKSGDVTLTVANGGFVDGLPRDDTSGSNDSVDEMVHRWIDAGLIDGEKNAQGEYTYKGAYIEGLEKARDDYAADVTAAYDPAKGGKTAADWQTEYNAQKTAYQSYLNKKADFDALSQAERKALEDKGDADYAAYKHYSQYGSYDTADDFLKANSTAYKYAQYDSANAYLAADATYQDLVAKAANPTFEWTKDMMLNAVSEKMVNKDSGSTNQTDGAANVLGHNVTLTSSKAVGTVSDETKTITVEELAGNDAIDKMKELMRVGASDVTVNKDDKGNVLSFTIKGNMPLGVFLKEKKNQDTVEQGTLNVTANGNVSVAGRKDEAGDHSAINVGAIDATTAGDVRLYSDKGVYNAKTANDTNITGKNLIVTGGTESIGEAAKPLTVSLSGDLTEARADQNVFIKNMKQDDVLRLGAMFAGDTISLTSDKGFLMSSANSDIADSYINAGKKLVFNTKPESDGVVGNEANAIRILNDRAPVDITAKSAYIKGMSSLALGIQNGTLVLGDVNITNDFTVASEGKIAQTETGKIVANTVNTISGESLILENEGNQFSSITVDGLTTKTGETPAIAGDVRIAANANKADDNALTVAMNRNVTGDISVQNRGDLTQKADTTIAAGEGKTVTLTSTEGAVTQAAGTTTGIQAKTVNVTAATGVDLQGTGNEFDAITVKSADENEAMQGSVLVKDNAAKLTLDVQPTVNGNIAAENTGILNVDSALHATGTKAEGKGDISLTSGGDVSISKDVTTGTSGPSDINFDTGALTGPYNSLTIHAGGSIQEAAGVNIKTPVVETYSGKGVSLESEKNTFGVFVADDLDGTGIKGSVKAKTNATSDDDKFFTVGVAADIFGDAEFTNLHEEGEIGILLSGNEDTKIDVLGGNGADGNLVLKASQDVTLLGNINAKHDIVIDSANGEFFGIGKGMEAENDITVSTGKGATYVGTAEKGMEAGNDIKVTAAAGDIFIGADGTTGEKTLAATNNITVETGEGTINILGATTTTNGDITMTAGKDTYTSGWNTGNFIIGSDGALISGGGITLNGRNGDILITEAIQTGKELTVNIAGQGNASFGTDVLVTNDVNISTDKGSITVGNTVTSTGGNVNMTTGAGNIAVEKAVTAAQDLAITTGKGNIDIGDNGPGVPTVTAKQNATVGTELGIVTIQGKTEAQEGDVTLYAGSEEYTQAGKTVVIDEDGKVQEGGDGHTIVINQNGVVKAGQDVNLGALNDDILVTDRIQAGRDVTTAVTGKGRIFFPGQTVDAKEEINIALENGDFILNRGNGTRVSIWLENNSELSHLGEILADANGTADPDVYLTGNYITVDSITKKNGGSTFQFSAIGKNGQKYISEEITVDSLRSNTGTQMPSLWTNRGYLHVDDGKLSVRDLLAGDKIHLENDLTTVGIYGRTPTKDGEQLVYWNNVGMANSKRRGFDLYTDGKIGTYKAVLVDSGRYYYKLTGDNLSVVDMMRDRVTHERGEYTFDSAQLTEPGRLLREPVFFGMEGADVVIQQQNASDAEIVVEG